MILRCVPCTFSRAVVLTLLQAQTLLFTPIGYSSARRQPIGCLLASLQTVVPFHKSGQLS